MVIVKKSTKVIDNLILFSLCLLIIGLPFSNSIIEIAASAAIGLWLIKKVMQVFITHNFEIENTPLNIPISVYFIFVALSMINSKFFMTSLTGFGFKAMEHFLLFVVIVDTIKTKADFKKLIAAVLFSCALIGIDGMWQFVTGYDFIRGYALWNSVRITASFKYPNGFGGWLITVMPLCISLAIFNIKEKQYRALATFLGLLLLACLILSFTRAAWVAFIFAIMFLVWKKGNIAKKILLISLFVIILGFGLLTIFDNREFVSLYITKGSSVYHRIEMAKICWQMFLDHPLFGHGINTFMSIYENYLDVATFGISYAHNCYLQIAVETGIFSLLAFLWLIGALFISSLKNIKERSEGFIKATQIGLLAGLLAYLVDSALETNLYALQLAVLFYYFLGLVISIQKLEKP